MPTWNFVSRYGVAADVNADVSAKWSVFRAEGRPQSAQVILQLDGRQFVLNGFDDDPGAGWSMALGSGISDLIVQGTSGTIISNAGAGGGFVGGSGQAFPTLTSPANFARLFTTTASSNQVRAITQSALAVFSVGDAVCVMADDLQGFGQPQNSYFFKYAQITNISGDVVTLSESLPNEVWKSTWPNWAAGSVGSEPDLGGPVSMFRLDQNWKGQVEYQNIAFTIANLQTYCKKQRAKFTNCTWVAGPGCIPTGNVRWEWSSCDWSGCDLEVDKMIEEIIAGDFKASRIQIQSSSIGSLSISNGSVITTLEGTAKLNTIADSTIGTLKLGAAGYGASGRVIAANSTIDTVTASGVFDNGDGGDGIDALGVNVRYSMVGGVITNTVAGEVFTWAVPGAYCRVEDEDGLVRLKFRITDISKDGSNHHVATTDYNGGWPDVSTVGSGRLNLRVHPCPDLTVTSCETSGAVPLLPWWPARQAFGSYWKVPNMTRATIGSEPSPNFLPQIWGALVYIKVTVHTPYAGATNPLFLLLHVDESYKAIHGNGGSTFVYNPKIDLRTAGVRIITPSGVTGAVGADTGLTAAADIFMTRGIPLGASADISGTASGLDVTFEIMTDHGIVLDESIPEVETESDEASSEFLALHSDHAPVKHYAKLDKVEQLVRRVAPERIPEPTILPRDFFEDVPKKKRRFTIADGFSDA